MQENLKAKYRITTEELKRAVDKIDYSEIIALCGGKAFVALDDLLKHGDIAGKAKPDILFKSSEHELFYNEMLAKCEEKDSYHRALFYALGINEDTRNHINEIYDFSKDCIDWDSLKAGWVTGSTARAMRLGFNLYTCDTDEEDEGYDFTPSAIFGYGDAEYFFQAIKLRYNY